MAKISKIKQLKEAKKYFKSQITRLEKEYKNPKKSFIPIKQEKENLKFWINHYKRYLKAAEQKIKKLEKR